MAGLSLPLPDLFTWTECCNLLTTALVGFNADGVRAILDCREVISAYSMRYGPITWPLLRLEYMERLHSVLRLHQHEVKHQPSCSIQIDLETVSAAAAKDQTLGTKNLGKCAYYPHEIRKIGRCRYG